MKYYSSIALAALIAPASAYDPVPIAGYLSGTDVLDHGAIDLDEAAMESAIGAKTDAGFADGKAIYEEGGNSKSVATLTLSEPLTTAISKSAVVSGVSIGGGIVTATAYAEYPVGSTTIDVKYTPMTCLIGALSSESQVDSGCFALSGEVSAGSDTLAYSYSLTDNNAKRTLQGFSTAVESKMSEEVTAMTFKDYYGSWDYADQIVQAAFTGGETSFTNGDADFSTMSYSGKEQIVKKGIVYMNVLMYALHEFEAAIKKCEGADPLVYNRDPVHAWDEGVAFFVGNLEGFDGSGSGKLVYALGDKRCKDFGTCGASGDMTEGTSQVNLRLTALFNRGNAELVSNDCAAAEGTKNEIIDLMFVPVIQGTLKYAYKGENGGDEKAVAEGTAFAHAVLPVIHAANAGAAETIYASMKTNADAIVAADVKAAFESVYEDIGVTCEQIGGLLSDDGYYPGMEPCKTICGDKPQGNGKFIVPSMGLEVKCGELNSFDAVTQAFMCGTTEGIAACPSTCSGACTCSDDKDATYTKNDGEEGTCADVAALGYGTIGNGRRRKFCEKEPNAKSTCPGSCRGWCYFEPPFGSVASSDEGSDDASDDTSEESSEGSDEGVDDD